MNFRGITLFRMYISSVVSRIRHDLASELVVAVSSLILFLLFGYIFQDFINVKLATLPQKTQELSAIVFSCIVLVAMALYLNRVYNNWLYEFESIENISNRLGEQASSIGIFRTIKYICSQLVGFGTCHILIANYIHKFSWSELAILQVIISSIALAGLFIKRRPNNQPVYFEFSYKYKSPVLNLIKWRLIQIILRHRLSQLCLAVWLVSFLFLMASALSDLPYATTILLSMIGSLGIAGAIIFQIQADMEHVWLEQNLGVSQEQFCLSYLILGTIMGLCLGILCGASYFICSDLANLQELLVRSGKICLIVSLGPIAVGPLMFQVDPKRPIIQFFSCFFVCLFLGTGIFAHGLTSFLIPALVIYGMKYQKGNYYKN